VAFTAYLAMLQWPMIAVGWVVNIFERGEASMGRLGEILDAPPASEGTSAVTAESIRGEVEIRDLNLILGDRAVLRDVRLKIPAGAVVAIVGPTGSGKSTLVSLLARLVDPPRGQVFIDGHDVRDLPLATLRRVIGMVPQEPFLFSSTVRENITFGARTEDGSRLAWAAEVSQIARDVQQFPEGYDTPVGERGITLSGGQKQRAALARALVVDPRILVLDDAFSAVDTETEERILRGLKAALVGRTTFLVSHRVSTVKDADLIVVLRDGRLVESGTHAELLGRGGFYAELGRRQLLEREVESA
jgi:ATP-binding cassette, subfamily B, multidrug efflux pump